MNPRTPKPIKRPAGFKPNNQQLKMKNKIKYFTRDPQRKDLIRDPFETYSGNISDYYFVDYHIVEPSPRWIRQPFVHKDDMKNIIRDIYMMQIDDEISVTDIRIQSERWLSELRDTTYDETAKEYAKDSITNREYFFGPTYTSIAEAITSKGRCFIKGGIQNVKS